MIKVKHSLKQVCDVCEGNGYCEVTQSDAMEYIQACQDCNGFTLGTIGDSTGSDERAREKAMKDGYKLNPNGLILE